MTLSLVDTGSCGPTTLWAERPTSGSSSIHILCKVGRTRDAEHTSKIAPDKKFYHSVLITVVSDTVNQWCENSVAHCPGRLLTDVNLYLMNFSSCWNEEQVWHFSENVKCILSNSMYNQIRHPEISPSQFFSSMFLHFERQFEMFWRLLLWVNHLENVTYFRTITQIIFHDTVTLVTVTCGVRLHMIWHFAFTQLDSVQIVKLFWPFCPCPFTGFVSNCCHFCSSQKTLVSMFICPNCLGLMLGSLLDDLFIDSTCKHAGCGSDTQTMVCVMPFYSSISHQILDNFMQFVDALSVYQTLGDLLESHIGYLYKAPHLEFAGNSEQYFLYSQTKSLSELAFPYALTTLGLQAQCFNPPWFDFDLRSSTYSKYLTPSSFLFTVICSWKPGACSRCCSSPPRRAKLNPIRNITISLSVEGLSSPSMPLFHMLSLHSTLIGCMDLFSLPTLAWARLFIKLSKVCFTWTKSGPSTSFHCFPSFSKCICNMIKMEYSVLAGYSVPSALRTSDRNLHKQYIRFDGWILPLVRSHQCKRPSLPGSRMRINRQSLNKLMAHVIFLLVDSAKVFFLRSSSFSSDTGSRNRLPSELFNWPSLSSSLSL